MARVLEGDGQREPVPLGARPGLGEQLGHVHDRQVEPGVLQVRAAAGRVDDDALGAGRSQVSREPVRARVALCPPPRVQVERAAALLPRRRDDVVALGREHPRRGCVDVVEENALDAAEQEPDTAARLAVGRA